MIELQGDLWEVECDARVITTNGFIKKNGEGVMGAGVAKQAAEFYPQLPSALGHVLLNHGNIVCPVRVSGDMIVFFPVKHHWREKADPKLIIGSALQLRALTQANAWERVAMPRPGCGNGGLHWPAVRQLIDQILDDRFVVVQI